MAKIYAAQIEKGAIIIEDVPVRWRKETETLLNNK